MTDWGLCLTEASLGKYGLSLKKKIRHFLVVLEKKVIFAPI